MYTTYIMLAEHNGHERDGNIRLDEPTHVYHIAVGERVVTSFTSVTKFVKGFFAPFDRVSALRAARRSKRMKYAGKSDQAIFREWSEAGKEAAEKGTALHEKIENFFNGEGFEVEDDCVEDEQFMSFWRDHKDSLEPYRTEWAVYDEGAQLAGSIDMVFRDKSGKLHIYDWKRTKKIDPNGNYGRFGKGMGCDVPDCSFWHYALQLNTYKFVLEARYGVHIHDLYLVRLHPTAADYEKIKLPDLQDLVSAMVGCRQERSNCLKEISLD